MDDTESELPSFSESQFDEVLQGSLDPLVLSSNRFDLGRVSPTSSNEVEIDSDDGRSAQVIESDSAGASPREEMLKDAQDGTDTWNT
jgi:hypothetical protein